MSDERWQPTPIPSGDGRHDIGEDVRAAIVERLIAEWSHDPEITAEKARQLAMWAGASVRALFHELGTLSDMDAEAEHAGRRYIPERDGRRCVEHPKSDHELVCLTCLESSPREPLAAGRAVSPDPWFLSVLVKDLRDLPTAWADTDVDDRNMLTAKWRAALASRAPSPVGETPTRPKIICLCGSTRFIEQFAIKTWELELEGHIVLGCTLLPMWYCGARDHFAEKQGVKGQRDEHHKRKIDLADRVLVLNYEGYIGESTRNEIEYAATLGKPIDYVEPLPAPPVVTPEVT